MNTEELGFSLDHEGTKGIWPQKAADTLTGTRELRP